MDEHTKEPWQFNGSAVIAKIKCSHHHTIAELRHQLFMTDREAEANARRIVACVNACAGVPNEELEFDNVQFIKALHERRELRQQRDELLAALKEFSGVWERGESFASMEVGAIEAMREMARTAIANAEASE